MRKKVADGKYYKWYDIYCRFFSMVNDKVLNSMPTNLLYKMLSMYMKTAISYFENDCYKNISEYKDFKQHELYFKYDGTDNQLYVGNIDELIDTTYENIYIGYRFSSDEVYTEVKEFTYDEFDSIITIEQDLGLDGRTCELYIAFYNIGEFNENEKLNDTEVNILVLGLQACWINNQRLKENLLNQRTYMESNKMYSQANHMQTITELYQSVQFKEMQQAIISYTFKQTKDNCYWMLGGRESAYGRGEL